MRKLYHIIPVLLTGILLFSGASVPLQAQDGNVLDTVVAAEDSATLFDQQTEGVKEEETPEPDTTVYRSVPDSVIARLKKEKEFAYANDPDYWKKEDGKTKSNASRDFFEWLFTSKAVRFIAYFILAFILLYAVYKIIINNNLFYNPARKKALAAEEVKEEINKDQLDERIATAVKEQDYRKAVRWYFLKTLFDLDARGLIRYHPEGTNNDYIVQLGSHSKAGEFSYLTQVYEYVWYGGFSLEPRQFESVEQRFRQFIKSKNSLKRLFTIAILVLFGSMFLLSCNRGQKKVLNERVTLWRKDKIPYGTWFSFEQLHRLFPKAEIVTETPNNNKKTIFNKFSPNSVESKIMMNQGKSVRIIISPFMSPTAEQWSDLQQFVSNGNQLLISSLYFSDMLLDSLKLKIGLEGHHETIGEFRDSLTLSIADPATQEEKSFTYPGRGYDQYFSDIDTGYTAVLGWNAKGKPDFVRINYNSGGSIFIHLAPMAFTNFFLLHKDNKEYYDRVMSYFRYKAEVVVLRIATATGIMAAGAIPPPGAFGFLMKQPALAWALWLLLILFGLIYFFSSRRKQRIIPVIQPLKNTSLDFVKTIGRLYFQRRDNHNLVQKMTTHFQTHIRNRYNIPSFNMDEEFVKKLAYKSGQSYETLYALVYQAKYLSDKQSVTDTELMNYNALLENFYKSS